MLLREAPGAVADELAPGGDVAVVEVEVVCVAGALLSVLFCEDVMRPVIVLSVV